MFPERKQFSKWSLPSKYTFAGFWFGTLLGIAGVVLGVKGLEPTPESIYTRAASNVSLEVSDVKLRNWLGDSGATLTVDVTNPAKVPANFVKARLGDGKEFYFPEFRSAAFDGVDMSALMVGGEKTSSFPIVPIEKIEALLGKGVCGVSLKPTGFFAEGLPESCKPYASSYSAVMFMASIDYKTIFGDSMQQQTAVWVFYCDACEAYDKAQDSFKWS